MSIFEFLKIEVENRPHQYHPASDRSLGAMNGLVNQALGLVSGLRSKSSHDRHLFLAVALGRDELSSSRKLSQAEVSALIEWLKDPQPPDPEKPWVLKPGIESDIAEVGRACMEKMGQMEIPWG